MRADLSAAQALRNLVSRWGSSLPDVEFVVETQDTSFQDLSEAGESGAGQPAAGGAWSNPHYRLPVMRHCRADSGLDITVPIFHFYTLAYDELFLQNSSRWAAENPWERRLPKAFAAGTAYHRHQGVPATTRAWDGKHAGEKVENVRLEFSAYTESELRHPGILYSGGHTPIAEWVNYRMVMHMDGISCSSRLPQLLTLGSVVLREVSGYQAFFDKLLQKFVHYVPFWAHRPREVLWAYNWVNSNTEAAQRVAAAGAAFAREYLNRQAVECYWLLLLQQYARLQRFAPGQRKGQPLQLVPIDTWLAQQVRAERPGS
ncbi:hypothetical protein GPECTOR_7g1043 [Gonium pectorale]|uniref:Glycosyl transferase CAP10 domain-containing protein n=1 Tax=Gonium pectorale TaxID=33097 RepID=A0A150GTK6_GONPE|nr:hypothetical protein GPECTOR_7g1043 [Gonium pectorale]|eukprot:KXZ53151.1 hypothetical protein GPECTOR_7g1043 [Gonium pectorale]